MVKTVFASVTAIWIFAGHISSRFCLYYFRISEENSKIIVEYHKIDKTAAVELTPVQRMIVSGKKTEKSSANTPPGTVKDIG